MRAAPGKATHPVIRAWATAGRADDPVRSLEPLPWGFSTPTAAATTAGGSRIVIQLFPDGRAAARSRRGARWLRRAGVPAPRVLRSTPWQGYVLVVTEFIPGTPAAALIPTQHGVGMARAMGEVAARIGGCVAPGSAAGPWSDPDALARASVAWAASTEALQAGPEAPDLPAAVAVVSTGGWTPAMSHGDFVPANALMIESRVQALVDTADVGFRHPLVDAAWWCLMVRHHHPRESERLTSAFLEASGLGDRLLAGVLPSVALLRGAELVAGDGAATSDRLPLLRTAARWARESGTATG